MATLRRAVGVVRTGLARLRDAVPPVRWAAGRWRGSLQVRIVASTLVLSAFVALILGLMLVNRVANGLVNNQQRTAVTEVESGASYAKAQLQSLGGPNDPELQQTLGSIGTTLSARGGQAGRFGVVVLPTGDGLSPVYSSQLSESRVNIPAGVAGMVRGNGDVAYQYTSMNPDGDGTRPFLVVGSPVQTTSASLDVFYLFPLDSEVATTSLVSRSVTAIGAAFAVLLALIAFLLTRQLVLPVRAASRTARELADGELDRRMTVRGEDELAVLARSFNTMAGSLQHQIMQLEELSRLQRRFTSDVSHELRTPLTTVRMAADLLYDLRGDLDAAPARSAELLHNELDRFESLLSDLLEISRFDAGAAVLDLEPGDLVRLVRAEVEAIGPLATDMGVTLSVSAQPTVVMVEMDPRRIQRITRNLLSNAIDHAQGKPVEVTIGTEPETVTLTVTDHGLGLNQEQARRVFDRFWRADESRARRTGGTGLGLSISAEDAALHGGTLLASGEPGAGARFVLRLPRASVPSSSPELLERA